MNRLVFISALTAASMAFGTVAAKASTCGEEVTRLETLARANVSNPSFGPSGDQSIGAQLEHQPTEASVKHAKARALAKVERVLRHAKAYGEAGKQEKCMKAVGKAKLLLGL